MKTDEGNILIAEFMGLKTEYGVTPASLKELHVNFNGTYQKPKYHSSWDWLMPIVEKIESKPNFPTYSIFIIKRVCRIHKFWVNKDGGEESEQTVLEQGNSKIEATWLAVIKFINHYNTHQK